MRLVRISLIFIVVAAVVIAVNFILRKPAEAPSAEFPGETSDVDKETSDVRETGAPTTPTYSGRPLSEVRIGDGFSGSPEVIELKRKSLEEHVTEVQKNPGNVETWLGIGVIKKFFNDYEGARDVWEYTAQIFPSHSLTFANLGNLYGWYLNNPTRAVSNWRRAITLSPFEPNYYLGLAEFYLYIDTANSRNTVGVIEEGMANNPRNVNLPLFLAAYFKNTGETASAIKYFKRVLELAPDTPGVREEIDELMAD